MEINSKKEIKKDIEMDKDIFPWKEKEEEIQKNLAHGKH